MTQENINKLNNVIEKFSKNQKLKESDYLDLIVTENRFDRALINLKLAAALFESKEIENLNLSKVLIERAWLNSNFSESILDLYINIHLKFGDIQSIANAFKRLGMISAGQKNIEKAVFYFNKWEYTYDTYLKEETFSYDFDILDAMINLALPYRKPRYILDNELSKRKIRLAILVKGTLEVGSVLIKILNYFAKHLDKNKFDVLFVIPEKQIDIKNTPSAMVYIDYFLKNNCKVISSNDNPDLVSRLLETNKSLNEFNPDILLTTACLSDYSHYFLYNLNTVPITVSLTQGPPSQFTPLNVDWAIAWDKHISFESISNCTHVHCEWEKNQDVIAYSKEELNLPLESIIISAAGRHVKYQSKEWWKAVSNILVRNKGVYLFALGVKCDQIPFFDDIVSQEVRERIIFFGWRQDYHRLLSISDIHLDFYPTSGGATNLDAMAFGIPVVSFKQNYFDMFDPKTASFVESIINDEELIVEQENFVRFEKIVQNLIDDKELRTTKGNNCKENQQKYSNPEVTVRKCEEVFFKLIQDRLGSEYIPYSENNMFDGALNSKTELSKDKGNLEYWKQMQNDEYFEKHDWYGKKYGGLKLFGNDMGIINNYTNLSKSMNTVVIGCGYGRESVCIAPHVNHVYGIDVSETILNKAVEFTKQHGVYNFTPVLADNWEESIPENIDFVYTIVVFQHLSKSLVRNYISGLRKKMNAGGRFLCQFCESEYGSEDAELKVYEPNVKWTRQEIVDLIKENNLNEITIQTSQETDSARYHWALFEKPGNEDKIVSDSSKSIAGNSLKPTFSVIVPSYNQADYLPAALDTLLNQTFDNWEAIIVNDGSTDNTKAVMEEYARKDSRFKCFHKENGGVSSALNVGIRHSTGEWICWLSSDDLFEHDKLEIHYKAIQENQKIKFFCTHWYILMHETQEKISTDLWLPIPQKEYQVTRFFWANYVHGNAIAIHRTVFDDVGLFDESLRQGQDFDMWLRISAKYESLFINKRTCVTRIHEGQTTNSFVEGGVLDSTRALFKFLNNNSFEALFPHTNFSDYNQVTAAILEVFLISTVKDAFLYSWGFTTALAEKTLEWISNIADNDERQKVFDLIEKIVQIYLSNPIAPELIDILKFFLNKERIKYNKHEITNDLEEFIWLNIHNGNQQKAIVLETYLNKIITQSKTTEFSNVDFKPILLGYPIDNEYSDLDPKCITSWKVEAVAASIKHSIRFNCNDCSTGVNIQFEYEMTESPSEYKFICPECKKGFLFTDRNFDEFFLEFHYIRVKEQPQKISQRHVVFLIPEAATIGGGTKIILKHINDLIDLGCSASLCSYSPKPDWIDGKINYIQIKAANELDADSANLFVMSSIFDIPGILNKVPISKVVLLCQGYEGYHYGTDFNKLRSDKHILTKLHAIPVKNISISSHLVELFKEKFDRDVEYIPNSIDHNVFTFENYSPDREKSLLFIGNPFHPLKGFHFLAGALKTIQNSQVKISSLKLYVVMGFELDNHDTIRMNLEREIGCRVEFLFKLSSFEIASLMKRVSIVICTSWYEGFSLPLIEAMACGTPVITTNNMGSESFCKDKTNSFVVRYGDNIALAQGVVDILYNRFDLSLILQNAYQTSLEYSELNFKRAHNIAYQHLLELSPRDKSGNSLRFANRAQNSGKSVTTAVSSHSGSLNLCIIASVIKIDPKGSNGGLETAIIKTAEILSLLGNNVSIVANLKGNQEEINGVNYISFNNWISSEYSDYRNNIDLLAFASGPDLKCYDYVNENVPKVLLFHHQELKFLNHADPDTLIHKTVSGVICVSEKVRNNLIESGIKGDKLRVIHNGIDTGTFYPRSVERDPGRIMFVGALVTDKNPHIIIQTFLELEKKYQGLQLHIFGTADLWGSRDYLNIEEIKKLSQNIVFHGIVSHEDLATEYSKSSMCIIPSNYESFSLVSLEAQACGCIPVAHNVGGLPETMIQSETGLLYSPNTPEMLAKAMSHLLDNSANLTNNRNKAIAWVRDNFSWNKTAESYQDYFNEIIQTKKHDFQKPNRTQAKSESSSFVSLIIPCYNHGKYLDDALNSVFCQDYNNYEIIIIDDASKDDSVQIAEKLIEMYTNYDIKLIKLIENKGQACARNTAIKAASGEYVITMDADDKIKPGFISKCVQAFENNKNIDIVYTDVQNFGGDTVVIPSIDYDPTKLVLFNFVTACSMFTKKMWEELSGYDETLRGEFEDWDFWLKAAENGFIGYHINEPLFNYRKSDNESYNNALKNHNVVKAKLISRHPVLFSEEQMKWAELVLGGDKHFIELNKDNPGMPFTTDLEQHLQNLALIIKDKQSKRYNSVRPRILFTMYGWNETGGGTTFPKSVAKELVSRGYEVGVFYASLKQDPAKPEYSLDFSVDDGVMLFGVYNRPAVFIDPDNPEREIEDLGIRKRFSEVLASFKPDVIHFHNFHGLSFVMAEEADKRKIPSCFTPHNYHMIDPNLYLMNSDMSLWKDIDLIKNSESVKRNPGKIEHYKKRIETTSRLLNEWVNITMCVSNRQKELLKEHCGDDTRLAVVHQSSDSVDRLWENSNLNYLSDRRIKKPIRIGFIGSILPIKGVHYIAAVAQAFDKSDVEFHIYGFAVQEYLDLLKKIDQKGNLVFHGEYQSNHLEEIARNLDIAIVPSLLEDCAPLVMLELHALRLPIIGARIGGIPDFIEPEVDGLLYNYDSVEDLLNIINRCVSEPQIIEKMRHNITQKHSFRNYINHLGRIYMDLAKGTQIPATDYNLLINDSSTQLNKTQMNDYNTQAEDREENYFEALSDRKIKVGSDRIKPETIKLNLGCGDMIEEGFINIDLNYKGPDIVNMDARTLEYEDESVETILAADLLQCFSHNEIGEVFSEWARVLKTNGNLIISCTSLKQISRLLLNGLIDAETASKLIYGNQQDEAHIYFSAFDKVFLTNLLESAGFTIQSYDESEDAESLEDINISIVVSAIKSEKLSTPEMEAESASSNQVSNHTFNFEDDIESTKNVKEKEQYDNSLLSDLNFNFDDKGEEIDYEVIEPEEEIDNQDYFDALTDKKSEQEIIHIIPTVGPQINIVWEGSQFVWHSLALINREICYNIIKSGVAELTIVPYEPDTFLPEGNPKYELLKQHDIRYKDESDKDVRKLPYSWIRHQWPPKSEEPKGSKWFIIQPWEFSTLRTDFVDIFKKADEVWTPSNYSRNSFLNSGIDFDHAQVIPNGCDPVLWSPMGKRYKFNTDKKLKLLFVGGTIYRKGIDILLQAYVKTFTGLDSVCLIIKDMGGDSFYSGQTAKQQIDIIQKADNSPEIIYIDDYFTEEQMVELYKACDVFVCPYRGEGFSLPTLEAMASGLPVIVTKGGSTDDFVDSSIGWLISAEKKSIGREIGGVGLTGEAFLLEPNEQELADTLKNIYGDPSQIFSKGLLASLRARTEWTWKKATVKLLSRLDLHNGTTMAKIAEQKLEDYSDDAIVLGRIEKMIVEGGNENAYTELKSLLKNTELTGRLLHHGYCRLAEICINLGNPEEAGQYLQKAGQIYYSIDQIYLEAIKSFAEEQYSDALDSINKAMQNWKDEKFDSTIGLNIQELLSFTADTLLNDDDPDGALQIYLEVLKLNNNNANAYFGAGVSHLKMGSNDDARRMFEWALRINPEFEMAKKMIDGLNETTTI